GEDRETRMPEPVRRKVVGYACLHRQTFDQLLYAARRERISSRLGSLEAGLPVDYTAHALARNEYVRRAVLPRSEVPLEVASCPFGQIGSAHLLAFPQDLDLAGLEVHAAARECAQLAEPAPCRKEHLK